MATTAAPQASCSLIRRKGQSGDHLGEDCLKIGVRTRSPRNNSNLRVFASQGGRRRPRPPPGEYDPRLHSGTGDEGWIGGTASSQQTKQKLNEEKNGNVLGDKFADLLNESDSHYQWVLFLHYFCPAASTTLTVLSWEYLCSTDTMSSWVMTCEDFDLYLYASSSDELHLKSDLIASWKKNCRSFSRTFNQELLVLS